MSAAPSSSPGKSTVFHKAATLCSVSALLTVLLGIVVRLGTAGMRSAGSFEVYYAGQLFVFLTVVLGVASGLLALCGIPKHGIGGILGKVIIGLLSYALLFTLTIPILVTARGKAIEANRDKSGAAEAGDEVRQDFQSRRKENGVMTNNPATADELRKSFDDSSKMATGEETAILRAHRQISGQIQHLAEEFEAQSEKLRNANVLIFSTVTDRSQLADRRAILLDFVAANDRLRAIYVNADTIYGNELAKQGVAPATIETALTALHASDASQTDRAIRLRDLDGLVAKDMLDLIKLMEDKWGEWKITPGTSKISFENDADQEHYRKDFGDLNRIAELGKTIQVQMVEKK